MPRVSNVDSVAPDDTVTTSTPSFQKVTKKSKKKTISSLPAVSGTAVNFNVHDLAGYTKSPFSSFLINPKVFTFSEKNHTEKILLALRPHWFTNVSWVIITIFMALAPSLLGFVPLLAGFPPGYQSIAVMAWYLVTFAYSFEQYLSWYFDVYIVTTERVVDISFNNLLDKKFSQANIENIQDVSSRVSGVSQTLLNYGTVLIQTASEVNQIIFEKVPNPDKIVKVLQELRHLEDQRHNHSDRGGRL